MTAPSTDLNRRLVVAKPTTVTSIPAWGGRPAMRVDPTAHLEPGKVYRLLLDPDSGTATIEEASP